MRRYMLASLFIGSLSVQGFAQLTEEQRAELRATDMLSIYAKDDNGEVIFEDGEPLKEGHFVVQSLSGERAFAGDDEELEEKRLAFMDQLVERSYQKEFLGHINFAYRYAQRQVCTAKRGITTLGDKVSRLAEEAKKFAANTKQMIHDQLPEEAPEYLTEVAKTFSGGCSRLFRPLPGVEIEVKVPLYQLTGSLYDGIVWLKDNDVSTWLKAPLYLPALRVNVEFGLRRSVLTAGQDDDYLIYWVPNGDISPEDRMLEPSATDI